MGPAQDTASFSRLKGFHCCYFDPKQSVYGQDPLQEKAFHFWRELWTDTLAKVAPGSILHSDEFIRHDEVIALFKEDEPVGLFGLNWYWTQSFIERGLRYWTHYPEWFSQYLGESRALWMSMSYLSVSDRYRRGQTGLPISDWLVGLAVKRFEESDASDLFTYTRNDRKTHELGHRHGGRTLDSQHVVHGIASDVLRFDRRSVITSALSPVGAEVAWLHLQSRVLSRSAKTHQAMSSQRHHSTRLPEGGPLERKRADDQYGER